jgi:hypothetical protein
MKSDIAVAVVTVIAFVMSVTSLFITGIHKADSVEVSLVGPTSIDSNILNEYEIALINSGTRPAIIKDLGVVYNPGKNSAGVAPFAPDQEVDLKFPIILPPGEIRLVKILIKLNYKEAFEFHSKKMSDFEPMCGESINANGTKLENRDVNLLLWAKGIDSMGVEHYKNIKNITVCVSPTKNQGVQRYSPGPVPLIRVPAIDRLLYILF